MTDKPQGPRILPLPEEEWSDEQRSLLARGTADGQPRRNDWFQTIVRHPKVYKHWAAYSSALLYRGLLNDHDREVLVLRNAGVLNASMQWEEHAKIARSSGTDEVTIQATKDEAISPDLDHWDALLVRAVDELHNDAVISDATWAKLAARLDDPQLIEIIMLVGSYTSMAWLQRSLKVRYGGPGDTSQASGQYKQDAAALGSR